MNRPLDFRNGRDLLASLLFAHVLNIRKRIQKCQHFPEWKVATTDLM
jgi:hypothetical protein